MKYVDQNPANILQLHKNIAVLKNIAVIAFCARSVHLIDHVFSTRLHDKCVCSSERNGTKRVERIHTYDETGEIHRMEP